MLGSFDMFWFCYSNGFCWRKGEILVISEGLGLIFRWSVSRFRNRVRRVTWVEAKGSKMGIYVEI